MGNISFTTLRKKNVQKTLYLKHILAYTFKTTKTLFYKHTDVLIKTSKVIFLKLFTYSLEFSHSMLPKTDIMDILRKSGLYYTNFL